MIFFKHVTAFNGRTHKDIADCCSTNDFAEEAGYRWLQCSMLFYNVDSESVEARSVHLEFRSCIPHQSSVAQIITTINVGK